MAKINKRIYRLQFLNSALHLARGKEGVYDQSQQVLHADTLKSALFACALQLYGQDKINQSFLDAFTLSSAFPFYEEEYFFPKPMARIPRLAGLPDEKQGKKLKKIQFLGKSYFENLLHGRAAEIEAAHIHGSGAYVSKHESILNKVRSAKPEADLVLMESEVQQRLVIPAGLEEDPTPFYMERMHFGQGAGLYFMLDMHEPEVLSVVESALRLLGDNGLGTDRSVGNGHFTFEAAEMQLDVPDNATHAMALSLYCPNRDELTEDMLNGSSYSLVKRGGWLASPENPDNLTLRKKSVYMFTEGSVFAADPKQLTGKLLNLQPETDTVRHPVWRDGRAMFVPINPLEA
ncbi:MAG: type III-A CRISPR-associated RAMP protein Csm4 [Hymenobacteraceae bacterium]|nr:type III-A CRISPR-associated RAMP protein Csm4 [Hymenobacteraceae bacterium]MDX5396586.1 type III-A CRISPR-associated RAMP protein Csm4 [Hymenobacteraceae bacterium]MDX5512649.1 type III-A CRISPR-associated RAMP protein Csm4 [Hymenobacteraceae bacterium]